MHTDRRQFIYHLAAVSGSVTVLGPQIWKVQAQSTTTPKIEAKSGVVVAADRDRIYANSLSGPLTIKVTNSTRVWKGEDGIDANVIRRGDDLAMRGITDIDGSFIPSEIWINITAFDGVIESVTGDVVEVDVIRNDSVTKKKRVRLVEKTMSLPNIPLKRDDLRIGSPIRVVGLALEDGTVQATKVTVFVGGKPLGLLGSKYIDLVTGKIIDKQ